MARTALERGDAERAYGSAREAETAAAGPDVPFHAVAYAGRQVGLAQIALGNPDATALRIHDPIPELERQRLLSAAASHRSDLAARSSSWAGWARQQPSSMNCLTAGSPDGRASPRRTSVPPGRRGATGRDGHSTRHRQPGERRLRTGRGTPELAPCAYCARRGKDELADQLSADALAAARRDVDVWCRVTAATLRAYVLVGRDNVQAAELVAEAADHWSQSAPIFGVLVPVAAEVYLQLGQAAEGERAIAAIRMPSHWQEAAQLALAGKERWRPTATGRSDHSLDAASALARAGRRSTRPPSGAAWAPPPTWPGSHAAVD